jgi:DNA-binding response OmpR family regulator
MKGSRPRILSVDDNEVLNFMRQRVLATAGFECDIAATAEQAFKMLRVQSYHAALLDFYLPDSTGIELAETLKKDYPSMHLVLVTGEEMCERSPAIHSYLVKGEGPEALIATLKSLPRPKALRAVAG